jgi:DNA-directed RNA polymerase specialized sigma24 family protein
MNAVIITIVVLLGVFIIFAFAKMARINNRIDDIFNKALTMQGDIEANTARAKDNYKLIAQVNTEVENVKSTIAELHKQEPADEPAKEVEEELEILVPEEEEEVSEKELGLIERRENFAQLRGLGKSVKEAGEIVGVSISTAKRYEQWRKDNKK